MKDVLLRGGILCFISAFSVGEVFAMTDKDYLCHTAESDNATVTLNKTGNPVVVNLEYSIDEGATWSSYTIGNTITLAKTGDNIYFRNADNEVAKGFSTSTGRYQFDMTGKISASGNIMSLIDKTCQTKTIPIDCCFYCLYMNCTSLINAQILLPAETLSKRCYQSMFLGCTNMITAPELAAIELADSCCLSMFQNCSSLTAAPQLQASLLADFCYCRMFYGCTVLKDAPALPATTLASNCYNRMFYGCTDLVEAPTLNATSLAERCFSYMFYGCSKLNVVQKELPAVTLKNYCYEHMFDGCSELSTAPSLPAVSMTEGCYYYMFKDCSNLTETPNLPATSLADYCYQLMFYGCTKLVTVSVLPATTLANKCYFAMFYKCQNLKTAPALPATSLTGYCYQQMFFGCTSLTSAPELPAKTLTVSCYEQMFYGCSNLKYVTVGFTSWNSKENSTTNWLKGVPETGTFECSNDLDTEPRGSSYIPSEWTVKNDKSHDKAAFDTYKEQRKAEADALAEEGDSEEVLDLIDEAKNSIDALNYDEEMTLAENKGVIDGIIDLLKENIDAQRAAVGIYGIDASADNLKVHSLDGKKIDTINKSGIYIINGVKKYVNVK